MLKKLIFIPILLIIGCAKQTPITKYYDSKSYFHNETKINNDKNIPKNDIYRIMHQGATGFVPFQSIREDAEKRAKEYCEQLGKQMLILGEQTSGSVMIPGNFPRIEICFACIEKIKTESLQKQEQYIDLFTELSKLDELRKKGLLTDSEFEVLKKKLLDKYGK